MQLYLDPRDGRSLAAQLYDQVREAITEGRLRPGARLQPTRSVAADLGVARSTVTEAYARLTAEGYTEGRRGGGTTVAPGPDATTPRRRAATALTASPVGASVRRYGDDTTARYDLGAGRLDPRLFPVAEWRRCTGRALAELGDGLGRYGDPAGSPRLRHALAHWVSRSRGVAATPEQVVVTHGAGHAVDLLARTLLRPGDVAAVEEPGYPSIADALRTLGVEVVGVPVDEHGLVVDALPDRARLVHVTPSHQFPLGVVLSRERRLALLRWASRHGAAVVEDDYDSELRYSARPLEPLHLLDRDGRVVYVGTFSKVLSPALRIGFAVLPAGLAPAVAAVRHAVDGGPSPVVGEALARFIEDGHLGRHLRRTRSTYAERHRALGAALARLGPPFTALPAEAGLHRTLLAPDAPDDDEIVRRAARSGLVLSTLRRTYGFAEPVPGAVVGFGAVTARDLPRAVDLLAGCLRG